MSSSFRTYNRHCCRRYFTIDVMQLPVLRYRTKIIVLTQCVHVRAFMLFPFFLPGVLTFFSSGFSVILDGLFRGFFFVFTNPAFFSLLATTGLTNTSLKPYRCHWCQATNYNGISISIFSTVFPVTFWKINLHC